MSKKKYRENGFTLLEIILVLILVGISTTLAGMWIVSVVNGYVFAKTNADTLQKAQLALTRIAREFTAISAVTSAGPDAVTYTRPDSTFNPVTMTLSLNGDTLRLNGDVLADNVASFSLSYCDHAGSNGCPAAWTSTSRIIEATLGIAGANNTVSTFTRRIAPRNL